MVLLIVTHRASRSSSISSTDNLLENSNFRKTKFRIPIGICHVRPPPPPPKRQDFDGCNSENLKRNKSSYEIFFKKAFELELAGLWTVFNYK